METKIISAFPGTGKSYYHRNNPETTLDSDSSLFSWVTVDGQKVRNPEFPANYIKHITENIGNAEFIFVSSHAEVRKALHDAGLQFYLVYPRLIDMDKYVQRYKDRGSPQGFIDLVVKNWDMWINECRSETDCIKIEMFRDSITEEIPFISNYFQLSDNTSESIDNPPPASNPKMKRMFGMMPSSEVEIEKRFHTGSNLYVTVQAGPNGWGILHADHSAEGQDVTGTTEANVERAVACLKTHFMELTEVPKDELCDVEMDECCGECCDE